MSNSIEEATDGKISLNQLRQILGIKWNQKAQQWIDLQFMLLHSDEARMSFAMKFIKDIDFRRFTAPYPTKDRTSNDPRDFEASTALSLTIANRSNALFHIKKYDSCLKDIDFALEMNYPEDLHFKLYVRRVKCLYALRRFKDVQDNYQIAAEILLHTEKITVENRKRLNDELKEIYEQSLKSNQTIKKMHENRQSCTSIPTLGENSFHSDCTEVKVTRQYGRGLYATKDIKAGDIVLLEKPFASVLKKNYYYSNCHECYKLCRTLIPCQYCSLAMFCSKECHEMSWKKYHDIECNILPVLIHLEILFIGSHALRTVIIASKMFSSLTEFYKAVQTFCNKECAEEHFLNDGVSKYFEVYNLYRNKPSEANLLMFCIYAAFLTSLLENRTEFFQQNTVHESVPVDILKNFIGCLLLRHILNQPHRIYIFKKKENGTEFIGLGNAVYAKASLINHSCDPNVFHYTCNSDCMIIRACRNIKQAEQTLQMQTHQSRNLVLSYDYTSTNMPDVLQCYKIFDSYGPRFSVESRDKRQDFLLTGYNFLCLCRACVEDWPQQQEMASMPHRLKCQYCKHLLQYDYLVYSPQVVCKFCRQLTDVTEVSNDVKIAVNILNKANDAGILQLSDITRTMDFLNTRICRPSYEIFLCRHYLTQYFLAHEHVNDF